MVLNWWRNMYSFFLFFPLQMILNIEIFLLGWVELLLLEMVFDFVIFHWDFGSVIFRITLVVLATDIFSLSFGCRLFGWRHIVSIWRIRGKYIVVLITVYFCILPSFLIINSSRFLRNYFLICIFLFMSDFEIVFRTIFLKFVVSIHCFWIFCLFFFAVPWLPSRKFSTLRRTRLSLHQILVLCLQSSDFLLQ